MVNNSLFKVKKLALASSLLVLTSTANAGYTINLDDGDTLTFGGYIKVDARYVSGDIAATDYWYGGGTVLPQSQSNFGISVNETRLNTKYTHGDVTGFIEIDFYGDALSGGGNEIISNSSNVRLRHAFIEYKDVLIGQTWTTFQNTSSLAESADFGGPLVASAFIRQGQIRYTMGNLQLSIENPESYGGNSIYNKSCKVGEQGCTSNSGMPDFIGKYTFKGDWGNVSLSGLARQLESQSGNTESALGIGVAGRINTIGKDDVRFQFHAGNTGRYVGVTAATDMVGEEVEETIAIMGAYRHFWNETMRSSAFVGYTTTEESDRERSHWGVNLFENFTKQLSMGIEVGGFDISDNGLNADGNPANTGDSIYVQFSTTFLL